MVTRVGDIVFGLGFDTKGLDKGVQLFDAAGNKIVTTQKKIQQQQQQMQTGMQQLAGQMQKVMRASETQAGATTKLSKAYSDVGRHAQLVVKSQSNLEKKMLDVQGANTGLARQMGVVMRSQNAAAKAAEKSAKAYQNEINALLGVGKTAKSAEQSFKVLDKEFERQAQAAQKSVNALIGVDTQYLKTGKSAMSAQASMQVFDRALLNQDRALQAAQSNVRKLTLAMEGMRGSDKAVNVANRAYQRFEAQLRKGVLTTEQLDKQKAKLERRLDAVRRKMGLMQGNTRALAGHMTDLAKSVQVALGPLSGVASRITAITSLANRNTAAIAGLIGGMIALGAIFTKATKAGSHFESQMKIIENRVRQTGMAAGFTADQFNDLAIEVGEATLTTATFARDAIVQLTTVQELAGDNFRRALMVAQDLAASSGTSLQTEVRRMVRALEDPVNSLEGLRRSGVVFTEMQKRVVSALVETGREAEAMGFILDEIEKKVGGNAVAAADSLAGAYDTLVERTVRYLEKLAVQSGAVENLTDTITDLSDRLARLVDQTNAAAISGTAFAVAIKGIGAALSALLENFDLILGALAGFLGAKVVGALIRNLGRVQAGFVGLTGAIKAAAGPVAALGIALTRLNPFLTLLSIGLGVFVTFQSRIDDTKDSLELYNNVMEKARDLNMGLTDAISGSNQELLRQAIAAKEATLAELQRTEAQFENLKQLKERQEELRRQGKGSVMGAGVSDETIARFQTHIDSLTDRLGDLRDEIDKLENQGTSWSDVLEDNKEKLDLLTKAGRDAVRRLREMIDEVQNFNRQVTILEEMGPIQMDIAIDEERAEKTVRDFIKRIEDAVPIGTKDRAAVQARDVADATARVLASFQEIGIVTDDLVTGFKELFAIERFDAARKAVAEFVDQIEREIDSTEDLTKAVFAGGMARREANIQAELASRIADLRISKESELARILEKQIRAREASEFALVNATILKQLQDELVLTQANIDVVGKHHDVQEQTIALVEKELELIERGVPLRSAQAEMERRLLLLTIQRQQELDKLTQIHENLEGAVADLGRAFVSSFEEAIIEGENLREILASLEQDIMRILFRALISNPLERGIEEGFSGVFEGITAGGPDLGGLISSGIQDIFGQQTAADTTSGITALGEAASKAASAVGDVQGMGPAASITSQILQSELAVEAANAAFGAASSATASGTLTSAMVALTAAANTAAAALANVAASAGVSGAGSTIDKILSGIGAFATGALPSPSGATIASLNATGITGLRTSIPGGIGGFQHGGSFTVPGGGSPDSKLLAMLVSGGEQVTVDKAGTGGGQGPNVRQTLIINVPNAPMSRETVNQIATGVGRATQRALAKRLA